MKRQLLPHAYFNAGKAAHFHTCKTESSNPYNHEVSEPYQSAVMNFTDAISGREQLLGVCELLTRISTDLSDVFFDMSEVTSHKAAVILAVVCWTQ